MKSHESATDSFFQKLQMWLLYRLSRLCTKTVQREKQSKSIRERELLDGREKILTPDPLLP